MRAKRAKLLRVPLFAPLTLAQQAVVAGLARGASYEDLAHWLGVKKRTIRFHAEEAATKIPGNLPPQFRCMMWARGATIDMLEGRAYGSPEQLLADMKKTAP